MKKINALWVVALLLVAGTGCKTDFDIAAPYKPITVAYGLLSQNDTAHYIRIQKAFLDGTKSALVMNKIADSNYWPNLTVVMKEIKNGAVTNYPLTRVDMAQEGYVKQPGDSTGFFTSPNYAYKFVHNLNENYVYRLVITNNDTKEIDSSETSIISKNVNVVGLDNPAFQLRCAPVDEFSATNVQGYFPNAARYTDGFIRFHYVDKNNNTNAQVDRQFDVKLPAPIIPSFQMNQSSNFEYKVLNKTIFNAFITEIPPSDGSVSRYIDSAEIFIYMGGESLYQYVTIANVQASGLTSDQIHPVYTNIQGANALGLFSTRAYKYKGNIPLTQASIQELMSNPTALKLNVKGRSDH